MRKPLRGRDLIDYLFEKRRCAFSEVLRVWVATCRPFEAFADLYKEKIRKKVRGAKTEEDLEDLQFELQVPYLLLLDSRFAVKYEENRSGPDFFVTFEGGINFNVEVKRIREANEGARFDKCMDEIITRIEAIPSKLAFCVDAPGLESSLDLADRLERAKEEIISFIADAIRSEENEFVPSGGREYPIPGFQGELSL